MKSNKQNSKVVNGLTTDSYSRTDPLEEEYIESLSDVERSTLKIAKEHLKTSFSLKKSIGYMKWLSARSRG